ncbi:MAG: hypothetical protein JW772_02800 [Candidatus Diapherotrites archaeon]|nr:hypothetical protein [Candidatus Diapherotrites archaeon]
MACAIRLEKIAKNFGKSPILDNVSFEVAEGELFGLLGPNGAAEFWPLSSLETKIYFV